MILIYIIINKGKGKSIMIRKKVKFVFIVNDFLRKVIYKKRKKGLMKKVNEFLIFCGINVCVIIYSFYDFNLEVWLLNFGV